jgi:hypothetical protein
MPTACKSGIKHPCALIAIYWLIAKFSNRNAIISGLNWMFSAMSERWRPSIVRESAGHGLDEYILALIQTKTLHAS